MIYINGTKASREDFERLMRDIANGTQTATAHTTKKGAIAFVTML